MKHTKRYEHTSRKAVNRDVVTEEWPEIGFITYGAPADPKPSVKVTDGVITELDGKSREEFDSIDYFIADYGINKETCEKVMNMESAEIARMLVDVNVSRDSLIPLLTGATPAKLAGSGRYDEYRRDHDGTDENACKKKHGQSGSRDEPYR